MLGRFSMSDMGLDILDTGKSTLQTLDAVLPAVKVASEDYIKVSPYINTMVKFAALFLGALFIFFSLWRIIRIATVNLYIDEEEICYRDRFVWRRINWSEVISVGRENDVDEDAHQGRLSKIKSLLILTHDGLKQFDMSSYSLTHGIETVDKIMDSRSTETDEDESTEEE